MKLRSTLSLLFVSVFSIFFIHPISAQTKLKIEVDERVELLTTIQLLSGYQWLTEAQLNYKLEVSKSFQSFDKHPAITLYKRLSEQFYGYNPLLFLMHYQLPNFNQIAEFTEEDKLELNLAKDKDSLELFLKLAKQFYISSHFHSFYLKHQDFYKSIIKPIETESNLHDYIGKMEKYYGQKQASYHVILSPLQMDAGFGPMIRNKQGLNLYSIVGPKGDSYLIPDFDKDYLFQELILHEFSHSFCNPIIDSFYQQLSLDSCLYDTIQKAMTRRGYPNWKSCLYEHFTRANEIVLTSIIFDHPTAALRLKNEIEKEHFIYLEKMVTTIMQNYSSHNPSLTSVMPLIIRYLDGEKERCSSHK